MKLIAVGSVQACSAAAAMGLHLQQLQVLHISNWKKMPMKVLIENMRSMSV